MRAFLRMAALGAIVGLAGCTGIIEWGARQEDSKILNPDSTQGARKHSDDVVEALQQGRNESGKAIGNISADASFFERQFASSKDVNSADKARLFLLSGLTLSNELCERWFQTLGIAEITMRQTADGVSAAGSLTTAMMGVLEAPTKVTGVTAAAFGFGKQAIDSVQANYLLTPDLADVRQALYDYRAQYATDLINNRMAWNFYSSRMALIGYDNTCSQLGVRIFISQRIKKTDPQVVEPPLLKAAVEAFVAGPGAGLFTPPLTVSGLVDLQALLFGEMSADVRTEIEKSLKNAKLMNDNGTIAWKGNANPSMLRAEILSANIWSTLDTRAEARIVEISGNLGKRAKVAEAVATTSAGAHAQDAKGEAQTAQKTAEGAEAPVKTEVGKSATATTQAATATEKAASEAAKIETLDTALKDGKVVAEGSKPAVQAAAVQTSIASASAASAVANANEALTKAIATNDPASLAAAVQALTAARAALVSAAAAVESVAESLRAQEQPVVAPSAIPTGSSGGSLLVVPAP